MSILFCVIFLNLITTIFGRPNENVKETEKRAVRHYPSMASPAGQQIPRGSSGTIFVPVNIGSSSKKPTLLHIPIPPKTPTTEPHKTSEEGMWATEEKPMTLKETMISSESDSTTEATITFSAEEPTKEEKVASSAELSTKEDSSSQSDGMAALLTKFNSLLAEPTIVTEDSSERKIESGSKQPGSMGLEFIPPRGNPPSISTRPYSKKGYYPKFFGGIKAIVEGVDELNKESIEFNKAILTAFQALTSVAEEAGIEVAMQVLKSVSDVVKSSIKIISRKTTRAAMAMEALRTKSAIHKLQRGKFSSVSDGVLEAVAKALLTDNKISSAKKKKEKGSSEETEGIGVVVALLIKALGGNASN